MSLSDKELLKLAAKAAGIEIESFVSASQAWIYIPDGKPAKDGERPILLWSPLTDDGDALRLAVKLNMHIRVDFDRPERMDVRAYLDGADARESDSDQCAATRRAIVRAAAEIGKELI